MKRRLRALEARGGVASRHDPNVIEAVVDGGVIRVMTEKERQRPGCSCFEDAVCASDGITRVLLPGGRLMLAKHTCGAPNVGAVTPSAASARRVTGNEWKATKDVFS